MEKKIVVMEKEVRKAIRWEGEEVGKEIGGKERKWER